MISSVRKALRILGKENNPFKITLQDFLRKSLKENKERFNSHLYSETADSPLNVKRSTLFFRKAARWWMAEK
jgi:hypothetical protein